VYVRRPATPASTSKARRRYEAAVHERRGVVISGICCTKDHTYAYVYGPESHEESVRLMFSDGLKLSLRRPLTVAQETSGLGWLIMRLRESLQPTPYKSEMFK
jgi:hypothetical protein